MLERLKKEVYEANMMLPKLGLVTFTWGNVSGIDREQGLIVIKPSGVEYDNLCPENMVVVDLNGNIAEGDFKPSSDTLTHIELYKAFGEIGGVVHTHSACATSFAQAMCAVKPYGTTHADYFYGEVPCTRVLTKEEVNAGYEKNTGTVIAECFEKRDYKGIPAVLVANHGPFAWGKTPEEAVHNVAVLETVAQMALNTKIINSDISPIGEYILDKHYFRKHGKNSYYGQGER